MGKDRKLFVGWIVVSKKQVFNDIDEWHQGHTHIGQERTWIHFRKKYFIVTQALVKVYCKMCIACSKKNLVGNVQNGSRKPIMLLNW